MTQHKKIEHASDGFLGTITDYIKDSYGVEDPLDAAQEAVEKRDIAFCLLVLLLKTKDKSHKQGEI